MGRTHLNVKVRISKEDYVEDVHSWKQKLHMNQLFSQYMHSLPVIKTKYPSPSYSSLKENELCWHLAEMAFALTVVENCTSYARTRHHMN